MAARQRSHKTTDLTSMMNRIIWIVLFIAASLSVTTAKAQFYLNQGELAELMHECTPELERLPLVRYDYKILYSSRNNSVLARNTFYKVIGEGDVNVGAAEHFWSLC